MHEIMHTLKAIRLPAIVKGALVLAGFLLGAASSQAAPTCPQGHCSRVSSEMNSFCVQNGMAGRPFMVFAPDGQTCLCPCSCVDADTVIDLLGSSDSFANIDKEDFFLTPMSSQPAAVSSVLLASAVDNAVVYELSFSNGTKIISSENHSYITADERSIAADALKRGDKVLDRNLSLVELVASKKISAYTGTLMNVIINSNSKKPEDHVLSTAGILSGDYQLQVANDRVATGVAIRSGKLAKIL